MDRRPAPGGGMLHPVALAALALLVANDHWWKAAWPSVWTGKISDFAGLALFPLLLQGLVEVALAALRRPWGPSRRLLLACVVGTAIGFALMKSWPPALEAYRRASAGLQWPARALAALLGGRPVPPVGRAHAVLDPTDLVALPAVLAALWAGRRRAPTRPTAR